MRISDWSSDVCSSDLPLGAKDYSSFLINIANSGADTLVVIAYGADAANSIKQAKQFGLLEKMNIVVPYMSAFLEKAIGSEIMGGVYGATGFWWTLQDQYPRSEEHTSELQSLMRNSSAVFCMRKQCNTHHHTYHYLTWYLDPTIPRGILKR